ncbi:MAG: phosphodiester glycosidase family protein [Clostridia bacterium]
MKYVAKNKKNKKSKKILIITLSVLAFCVASFTFAFYGPIKFVKVSWITSAMTTLSHKWLATAIYSDETIEQIMSENQTIYLNENSDENLINITCDTKKDIERIDIIDKDYKGYILKVYNPAKLKLVTTSDVEDHAKKLYEYYDAHNAIAAINGSGFSDSSGHSKGGNPAGVIMVDKKITFSQYDSYSDIIGFTKEGKMLLGSYTKEELLKSNINSAISFSPPLIINGKKTTVLGDGGWGIAPRTAIGQKADGTIILLVIDGRQLSSLGATIPDLQEVMEEHGAINATTLDGGSSSIMMHEGKNVNYPCTSRRGRYLPNAIIIEK